MRGARTMTLDEAVRHFQWSATHDYQRHDLRDGEITAIYGLGLYDADLQHLEVLVPGLAVAERGRVEHDHGTWVRVDVVVAS